MKPRPRSMLPCWLFFQVLVAAFLLSLAAGVSHATGPPVGSCSRRYRQRYRCGPLRYRQRRRCGPFRDRQRRRCAPSRYRQRRRCGPSRDRQRRRCGPPAIDNTWVDRTHSLVERSLFDAVVWFDRFFGGERVVLAGRPESILRWKTEFLWDEEEGSSFRSSVRASLRLPRLKDRWHLMFTSESRGDPNAIIPEDPGNPGLDIGSQGRTSSTELVYDIFRTPHSILDVGAGVRVRIPPNAFVRTRYQHARPVGFSTLGRFTATAYWDALDGPGESNQLDFERWFAPSTLLQWSNSFTIEEKNIEQRVGVGDTTLPPPQVFPDKRDHLLRGRLGLDPTRLDRTGLPDLCPVPPERLEEMALPRRGAGHPLAVEGGREPDAGVERDAAGGDRVHRVGADSAGRWRGQFLTWVSAALLISPTSIHSPSIRN